MSAANGVPTFTVRNGDASTPGVAEFNFYFVGRLDDGKARRLIGQYTRRRGVDLRGVRWLHSYRRGGAGGPRGRDILCGNRKIVS